MKNPNYFLRKHSHTISNLKNDNCMKKITMIGILLFVSFTLSKTSFAENFSNDIPIPSKNNSNFLTKKKLIIFDRCRHAALWGYEQVNIVVNQGYQYCMSTTNNIHNCTVNWQITVHNTLMEALYSDIEICEQYGGGQL